MDKLRIARFAIMPISLLLAACAQPEKRGATDESGAAVASADPAPGQVLAVAAARDESEPANMHIYKSPTCGCCTEWVAHVEADGFETELQDLPNVTPVKQRLGVPQDLTSCHTSLVGDYVVEGHVPADVIRRLLQERPEIVGIAVPGMPMGSPGMEGPYTDRYDIVAFRKDGSRYVFESR